MEVKTNSFYELRNRLYAAAAAGCSLIAEDFRLKRAVEAFQPMSEANKVFGKLYAMCNALISSADPASDIIDCIALADALAVTQGTYNDDSETAAVSSSDIVKPVHLTLNDLESYKEYLRKLQYTDHYFYEPVYNSITDPRLITPLFDIAGKNGSGVATFLSYLLMIYDEKIVPLLFESLDLYNKNATGNQVRIISVYFREKFNDEYIKLAENEEVAVNIRLAAVEAMQYCPENEERLLNLYKTSKGKIKSAALLSLIRMNAPSVEPIIEKAAANPKKGDWELLCESGSKAAEDYARKVNFEALYNAYNSVEKVFRPGDVNLLKNKKNVGDVFEKFGEYQYKWLGSVSQYNQNPYFYHENWALIDNIYNHSDKEYFDMIRSLYEKYPVVYGYSALFAALIEDPENAFRKVCIDHFYHDKDAFYIISKIFKSPDGWYRIKPNPCITENNYSNIKLFRKIPDDMIEFLSDQSVIYDPIELEKKFKKGVEFMTAKENMRMRSVRFSSLLCICGDDEKDKIKAAAAEYTWAVAKKYPISQTLTFLKEFGGKPLEEGMLYNYIRNSEKDRNDNYSLSYTVDRSIVSEEVVKKDCQRIIQDFSDNAALMTQVNRILEKLGKKE